MWTLVDARGDDLPEAYGIYNSEEDCEAFARELWEIPDNEDLPDGMYAVEIQQ